MIGKIIFILAATAVAVVFAFSPEELENMDINKIECDKYGEIFLLLPHFKDTSKFFMCVFGSEVEFSCPAGDVCFDFVLQVCNWKNETNCLLRKEKNLDTEGSGDYFEDFELGGHEEDGALANLQSFQGLEHASSQTFGKTVLNCDRPDSAARQVAYKPNCQKYWKCINGLPQTMDCSDGLFFNEQTQQCDFEANVKCKVEVEDELQGEFIVYK